MCYDRNSLVKESGAVYRNLTFGNCGVAWAPLFRRVANFERRPVNIYLTYVSKRDKLLRITDRIFR